MDFSINSENLMSIIENTISGVCVFALTESFDIIPVYINEGLYRMLGYTHQELEKMLKNFRRIIIPDDLPVFDQGINDILKDDGAVEFEFRTVTGDGGIRWLQVRANLYGKVEGYPLASCIVIDATERKSIEEQLALQAERLNILSASTREHLIDYNSRTDVLNIRKDNTAIQHGEIVIKDFMATYEFASVHEDDRETLISIFQSARLRPLNDQMEFRSSYFDDEHKLMWYRLTITSVPGADGYVSRIVGRVVNIDEQKKKELELQIRADKDSLTGLYNKGAATELISAAIHNNADSNQLGALLMFDLDHFKSVNDTFGHQVGDMVIADAGKIISDTFKGRDIMGRMGGDEFMVFMSDIKEPEDALNIAARLNKSLTKEINNSQGSVTVTASIGITLCDNTISDFATAYEQADQALYATKENGRNGLTLYSDIAKSK